MRVLVLGGGAIGTAVAAALAERGAAVELVERHAVAGAASGKSGGFLARSWCDGTPLEALARRSFALHAGLAERLDGPARWGYRRMTTWGGTIDAAAGAGTGRHRGPDWVSPGVAIAGRLGDERDTAQVDPRGFTTALMAEAERHGARLRRGTVSAVLRRGGTDGTVTGAVVDGEAVTADAVVLALGPWSRDAGGWLDLPPVWALKGHSVVLDTGMLPAEALFLDGEEPDGTAVSPEVFPRADGTTYVCAISFDEPLPIGAEAVVADAGPAGRLRALCGRIAPALAAAPVLASQACHRPLCRDGLPMLGAVPGAKGAFVATGHGVWGILNAPATGEAMAELILDGAAKRVELDAFDPGRPGLGRRGGRRRGADA